MVQGLKAQSLMPGEQSSLPLSTFNYVFPFVPHSNIMTESNHQNTHSVGIYDGLPTFSQVGQTAIVTGANGISGQAMLSVLLAHPDRWTSVYALSQGPPLPGGATAEHVKHISVNFLSGKEKITKALQEHGVKGDFVFSSVTRRARMRRLWSRRMVLC
jgi:hypothetical protein